MVAAYVAQAPDMQIENGVVCIKAISHGEIVCWHMPLLEFRRGVVRATVLLSQHDAAGRVVPFGKDDGPGHD
jgi:hypothetical protein